MGTKEEELREQIARIIDPIGWNVSDRGQGGTGDWEHAVRKSLATADLVMPLVLRSAEGAWDEAVQAVAWALDNRGSDDEGSALHYVASNNPCRVSVEGNE